VICVESLAVKNMVKNHCLAKSISDVGWGEFVRQLEYKSAWYGRTLVKIDRWYPSSKTCHSCKYVLDELDLQVRTWVCPECAMVHDRDTNAAKNILAEGVQDLFERTLVGQPPMKQEAFNRENEMPPPFQAWGEVTLVLPCARCSRLVYCWQCRLRSGARLFMLTKESCHG
jgi:transposase